MFDKAMKGSHPILILSCFAIECLFVFFSWSVIACLFVGFSWFAIVCLFFFLICHCMSVFFLIFHCMLFCVFPVLPLHVCLSVIFSCFAICKSVYLFCVIGASFGSYQNFYDLCIWTVTLGPRKCEINLDIFFCFTCSQISSTISYSPLVHFFTLYR